jgi:hypothetical protein
MPFQKSNLQLISYAIFILFLLQLVLSVKFFLFILTLVVHLIVSRILFYFADFALVGFLTVT